MTLLQSVLSPIVLAAGCVGYGGLVLSAGGARGHLTGPLEWFAFSFAAGLGVFGWLLFFPGIAGNYEPVVFWGLAAIGVGLISLNGRHFRPNVRRPEISMAGVGLLLVLAAALAVDLLEGISPPADADSLAYHFALPKQFLETGRIEFVARAVSGAIPLLVHMAYGAALGTGGELALTLWTMLTGWATCLLFYVIVRRHLPRDWAAAAAIGLLTTPAVLYGAGSGQVEIRGAAFALASATFIAAGHRASSFKLLALAGLCAGFFLATKYYGLIFVGAGGLVLLCTRDGLRRSLVFGTAAFIAGFQWYLWNWIHTGDPLFPMLTDFFQFPDSAVWTRDFGRYFADLMARGELPLERSLYNWLLYPVLSTFGIAERLEGGRTGFGILVFILLPLAIAGFATRERARADIVVPLLLALIFFTVWFFSGTAQRTRHLLPIYPLVLVALFPVAVLQARAAALTPPLAAGVAAVLVLQIAGQGLVGFNYAGYVFGGEPRAQFLMRNVPGANTAEWVNRALPPDAKVAFFNRQLAYLIERPSFMLHPHIQAVVDARPDSGDERKFIAQAKRQGITHFLLPEVHETAAPGAAVPAPFFAMIGRLVASGCLRPMEAFESRAITSRTLHRFADTATTARYAAFVLAADRCPPEP